MYRFIMSEISSVSLQEHDSVNYGPVQLCKKTKRTRGRGEIKELCDVYSYVVYQQLA